MPFARARDWSRVHVVARCGSRKFHSITVDSTQSPANTLKFRRIFSIVFSTVNAHCEYQHFPYANPYPRAHGDPAAAMILLALLHDLGQVDPPCSICGRRPLLSMAARTTWRSGFATGAPARSRAPRTGNAVQVLFLAARADIVTTAPSASNSRSIGAARSTPPATASLRRSTGQPVPSGAPARLSGRGTAWVWKSGRGAAHRRVRDHGRQTQRHCGAHWRSCRGDRRRRRGACVRDGEGLGGWVGDQV
jgi:hypothetical protein